MTCEYRSTVISSTTSTEPVRHTRPRSLRTRSTSITCSARSFGSASSSAASAVSSSGVAPRGRVPAIGCMQRPAPGHLDVRLGRGPDHGQPVEAQQVHVRRRVGGAQGAVDVERVGVGGDLEPLAGHHLEDVAGADVLLGPAHRVLIAHRPGCGPGNRPPAGGSSSVRCARPAWPGRPSSHRAGRPRRRTPPPGRPPRPESARGSRWRSTGSTRRGGRARRGRSRAGSAVRAAAGRPRRARAAAPSGGRRRSRGSRPGRR